MPTGYKNNLVMGQKFGKYTILAEVDHRVYERSSERVVLVRCDCGFERNIGYSTLKNGGSTQCRNCFAKSLKGKFSGENNPMFGKIHTLEARQRKTILDMKQIRLLKVPI